MYRQILRGLTAEINSFRYFNRAKSDSSKESTTGEDIAYEGEYFYRQDKQMLEILKQKTQDDVKNMQDEVRAMRNKIDEYNRDISESLRFLKGLEKDLSANRKK